MKLHFKPLKLMFLVFCAGSLLMAAPSAVQQAPVINSFQKSFTKFSGLVPGVDFFASDRSLITPFEKPFNEAIARLKVMLGDKLPSGCLVICKTAAEKDAVAEERMLKMGYKWALIQLSPQAEMEQRLAQMKASMGDQLPPEALARFQQRTPEQNATMLARSVANVVPRVSFAVVQTLCTPEKEFKGSRLDDVSRSSLADWIDIGLSRYAADSAASALNWTQGRLEELFPLEDLLQMNRPFVLPDSVGGSSGGGGGGGGGGMGGMRIVTGGGGEGSGGGPPPGGTSGGGGEGQRGGGRGGGRGGQMSKEVQDRMNFDNESALFFAYLVAKVGLEKTKAVIQQDRENKEIMPLLTGKEYFAKPVAEIEKEWIEWIKVQKAPEQQMFRVTVPATEKTAKPPE